MHPTTMHDLRSSGLTPEDLSARDVSPLELAATNINQTVGIAGYVIPYYSINGDPIPFYRIKLHNHVPKYKQPKGTVNHVYFPRNFLAVLRKHLKQAKKPEDRFIILTEGEKKACAVSKLGLPTVALGGVYNWRNTSILLPKDTTLLQVHDKQKNIRAKLPTGLNEDPLEINTLATGLQPLIDLVAANDITLIIVYDSDIAEGTKPEVQKAAALLGYELRFRGLPIKQIRQVKLPYKDEKVGLDDYLVHNSKEDLVELIRESSNKHCTFPRHPNPRGMINKTLQRSRLTRKEVQDVALAVLSELDARGRRFKSKASGLPYYFDELTSRLIPATLVQRYGEPLHESAFGEFLYKEFGLSAVDAKVITWLASQFTGEDPIEEAEPRHVITVTDDNESIALQLSDSQFALVSGNKENPIEVCSNGTRNILFMQDQVEPIDSDVLTKEINRQLKKPLEPWWLDVFKEADLVEPNIDDEHIRILATLLFYISPWFKLWRGTQLPVEMYIGEPGSGKSSLCELRLDILTGRPSLRNVPTDIRDWYASITNSGGIHVTDNVQFTNKDIRQRISDEICRLITEPDPHVEMRKLYTTANQYRIPARISFAMTSIHQPFSNIDFMQRATIFHFVRKTEERDGKWVKSKLEKHGGRIGWIAHHLIFMHKFLEAYAKDGRELFEKPAKHRLTNYEASMHLAGKVLGLDTSWLTDVIKVAAQKNMSEADWALDGLREFSSELLLEYPEGKEVTSQIIAQWASGSEEFCDNIQLTNARRLGRYMQSHKMDIERVAGIKQIGTLGNRMLYNVIERE